MSEREKRCYVLPWAHLLRWDLKSARSAAFRATHPSFRPLGEFIEEATELVNILRRFAWYSSAHRTMRRMTIPSR
jgi:hypothetical protein